MEDHNRVSPAAPAAMEDWNCRFTDWQNSRFSDWYEQNSRFSVLRVIPNKKLNPTEADGSEERKDKDLVSRLVKRIGELNRRMLLEAEADGSEERKDKDLVSRPQKKLKIDRIGNSGASGSSKGLCSYMDETDTDTMEDYSRRSRVYFIRSFIKKYTFVQGEKICIHNGGEPIFCMSDKCLESTWVGVYGMQSICIVIRRDMDMTRLPVSYQKDGREGNMRDFARAVISEVECLPHKELDYYDNDFRLSCINLVKKPFAVVSAGLGTLEETGYDESKPPHCCISRTMNFLESRLSSGLLDTHYDTLRAALRAYQLMCHKELRADDIWVSMLNPSTARFDHLPMDIISDQLAFVNRGCSSEDDGPQEPLFVYRGLV